MKKRILRVTFIICAMFAAMIYAPELGQAETVSVVNMHTGTLEKGYRYIDGCPLDAELQRGIFDICERYNVSYELVMSVIMQESSFRVNVVGDDGESIGLMQIKHKYHSELMEELGVCSLYNPLDNVEVGVALLAGYFERYGEVYDVLMAYNGGASYANRMIEAGKVSDYALEVTARASEYTEQNE